MNKCLDGMSPLPILRVATSEPPNDPLLFTWLLEIQDTLTSGLPRPLPWMLYGRVLYTGVSLVTQMVKNPPAMQETRFNPWVGKIPWRRKCLPTRVFLPEESHGQRSLVGYSLWSFEESDMTEGLTV